MTDQDATMSPTQSHYSIGMNEYTFEEDVVRRLNRLEDVVIHGQKPYALDDGGEGYGAQPGIAGGISGGGGELPTTLITPPNGVSQGDRDVKISGGIGQSRGTSSGAEGGTGTLDSDRWFATDGTVPAIETLRGTNATIKLDLSDCGTPSENLQRLIKDCGVSPLKLLELVQELPAYDFAKSLVDWFFKQINHTKYPIHETGFRTVFEDMYKKKGEGGPEPGNVRSLPLIFIVLAISVRLAPEEWAGDDRTRKLSSLRMYWCCESLRARLTFCWLLIQPCTYSTSIDLDCHSDSTGELGAGRHSVARQSAFPTISRAHDTDAPLFCSRQSI